MSAFLTARSCFIALFEKCPAFVAPLVEKENQGLYKLRPPLGRGSVTGHDFSRADKANKISGL
jgi:hypothetical protein